MRRTRIARSVRRRFLVRGRDARAGPVRCVVLHGGETVAVGDNKETVDPADPDAPLKGSEVQQHTQTANPLEAHIFVPRRPDCDLRRPWLRGVLRGWRVCLSRRKDRRVPNEAHGVDRAVPALESRSAPAEAGSGKAGERDHADRGLYIRPQQRGHEGRLVRGRPARKRRVPARERQPAVAPPSRIRQ